MSRNFKLLQRAAIEEVFIPAERPTPVPSIAPSPVFASGCADDEIANLVQRLFFRGGQPSVPRVVSFSGMSQGQRSSWICARVAESLASQSDASVCLVDANLWSPQSRAHVVACNRGGLAAALSSDDSIRSFAITLSSGNLWLMPLGAAKADLYMHVERWRARFAKLRDEFDYILVSAPPISREAEATLTGQMADGIVLIVEANKSRREAVRRAKERLENAQVQLLGAVLDQRTFPIPEFLYRKL